MPLSLITPKEAAHLVQQGALLVDIRSSDEYAREHIHSTKNIPFEKLSKDTLSKEIVGSDAEQTVIFYCRSGMRTKTNAERLANAVEGKAFILEGGIDAWKSVNLPVLKDASQPLALQRQVQIGAGSLALGGFILGITVSPYFHFVSGFVGAGLLLAGLTGFCGMANILMRMSWNKR